MSECICSSCKHLKSIIDENNNNKDGITEACEYGFPSENCLDCEEDVCELSCENYRSDDEEEKFIIAKCVKCAKEMKLLSSNDEEGEVYCVTCYLNK